MRDARWTNHVVLHVDLQLTIFNQKREKRGDVARVELAGVNRHSCWQIRGSHDLSAVAFDYYTRLAECTVAACRAGEIDDDRTSLHSVYSLLRDKEWSASSGYLCGGNNHVSAFRMFCN